MSRCQTGLRPFRHGAPRALLLSAMSEQPALPEANWSERLRALRKVRPVFSMVWSCAPDVVLLSVLARLAISVIPVALLWVARIIVDAIIAHRSVPAHAALPAHFWWLVALEFALASLAAM